MKPSFRRAFATAALAATLAAPASADQAEPQRVDRALEGWMVGDFTLVDQHGNAFTQEHLKDRWTFLLLGDTHCNEPCTAALSALAGMLRRIARADAVKTTQVLFVSLDPKRDTPEKLRRYLAAFDAHFVGATASRETLARLVEDLSPPGAPSGEGRKAGNLLLIGPDVIVRGEFLPPYDVLRLTEGFMKARIGR
jgi:protein SCO1/2